MSPHFISKSIATIIVMALGAEMLPDAKAQCSPLSLSNWNSSVPDSFGFLLDDEGTAQPASYLSIDTPSTNGQFMGAMIVNNATSYDVSGTVENGANFANGVSISFQYNVGTTYYKYSGAITVNGPPCNTFIAGTYSSTAYTVLNGKPYVIVSEPVAFSGQFQAPPFYFK